MSDKAATKGTLHGRQIGIMLAIMVMYFFAPTFSAVSSTFALMPDVYGVAPSMVSWISGTSNILSCVAGLIIGAFVGKQLSYRFATIMATAMFTVFGALPFFWQSIPFSGLLISRALFGFGMGCFNPLTQAILTHMITTETARAAWLGVCNIIFSIGASVGSIICGALALVSWQTAYVFYAFCVIALIACVIFVRDKDIVQKASASAESAQEAPKEKRHVPGVAWAFIIIFVFCTILTTSFFNYVGIAMADSGANTLLVGTVLTVFTVAGIVIAAANAGMWKVFRLWNFPLSYLLLVLSYILCLLAYNTGSTPLFFAASIVMGVGCCLCGMVMPMVMSVTVSAASLTLAIGLQEVARNLGGVFSSVWLVAIGGAFGDNPVSQFTASAVLGIAVTIAAAIVAAKYSKRFKNVDAEKSE